VSPYFTGTFYRADALNIGLPREPRHAAGATWREEPPGEAGDAAAADGKLLFCDRCKKAYKSSGALTNQKKTCAAGGAAPPTSIPCDVAACSSTLGREDNLVKHLRTVGAGNGDSAAAHAAALAERDAATAAKKQAKDEERKAKADADKEAKKQKKGPGGAGAAPDAEPPGARRA
jgi:hypothetical protein